MDSIRRGFRVGFSLAELLIALLILGVLAAFAIPKLLNQESSKKAAVFKDTLSALNAAVYEGTLREEIPGSPAAVIDYFGTRINSLKICRTDAYAEGCWPQVHDQCPACRNSPGLRLANGSTIAQIFGWNQPNGAKSGLMYVDWNGPEPPNLYGQDQILLCFAYGKVEDPQALWAGIRPGTLEPCKGEPASSTLYAEIFK